MEGTLTRHQFLVYQILIYDNRGRDIISPLLTVNSLRNLGVTLHLLISQQREPIPEVPAIYFVEPTKENVDRICQDLTARIYDSYYFNFTSPISRSLIEQIAQCAVEQDCVKQVKKLYDQYTNFICLEDDLFIMPNQQKDTFFQLNRPDNSESTVNPIIQSVVEGLYAVFATLGTVPIIRCQPKHAADFVAQKLESKFRDSLRDSRSSLFAGTESRMVNDGQAGVQFNFQRPLLVILDRTQDLAAPLQHAWSYQGLIHDIYSIKSNRVDLTEQGNEKPTKKVFDLSTMSDHLWREYKDLPFTEIISAISTEVDVLKDYEKNMDKLKQSVAIEGIDGDTNASLSATDMLTNTIKSLPQLTERKQLLDMHTHLATALNSQIQSRQLDFLSAMESLLVADQPLPDRDLASLLADQSLGQPEDRLRLLMIASLALKASVAAASHGTGKQAPQYCLTEAELDRLSATLASAAPGLDLSPLGSVKLLRQQLSATSAVANVSVDGDASKTAVFNKLYSQGGAFLRNWVNSKQYLKLTRIVKHLMENKPGEECDAYEYYDPKLYRRNDANIPRCKQRFNEAYVFVLGGGSYLEYHDMVGFMRDMNAGLLKSSPAESARSCASALHRTPGARRVIYGCTELLRPTDFLHELARVNPASRS